MLPVIRGRPAYLSQFSEDTTLSEESEKPIPDKAVLEKRLFEHKYKSLRAHKEKRTIDRSTRTLPTPRVIPYGHRIGLPDELHFEMGQECPGNGLNEDAVRPNLPFLPKIVSEGVLLFTPHVNGDGGGGRGVGSGGGGEGGGGGGGGGGGEGGGGGGGTGRKEKGVRIMEPESSADSRRQKTSAKTQRNEGQRTGSAGSHKRCQTPDTPLSTGRRSIGSGGKRSNKPTNNRVNSGKKENLSKQNGRATPPETTQDQKPPSRPESRASTGDNYYQMALENALRERRRSKFRRRKSSIHARKMSRIGSAGWSELDDSDVYEDTDSESEVYTPNLIQPEVALYRRACKSHEVVTSRKVEEGLTSGEVDASFSQLTRAELKVICVAIVESEHITKIDLSGNKLCDRCLSYLTEVMSENLTVRELNLSDCQADRDGIGKLIQCIQTTNRVTHLDLSGISLRLEQVQIVAEYIKNSTKLQKLCLSYCDIEDVGATLIGEALASANALNYLDMSWNQLRQRGALQFCLSLKENDTLETLDLSWNGLGREGCMGLEVALASNSTLRHLDISSNRIGVLGLDCLLRGLLPNTCLTSIKLGNNPLPTDSGTAIMNMLTNAPESAIRVLDLSHVAVEHSFMTQLTELRKLRVIYVFHGHIMSPPKKDVQGESGGRSLSSFDPILVLFEYMKIQNIRLLDLFRLIDTNNGKVISRAELRAVFLSLNMALPTGTFDAMFNKIDIDHNNVIDMDEMKLVHRRVLRQARALKARAAKKGDNDEDDEYGDVMHEFQDLVRKAVAARRSPRPSRVEGMGGGSFSAGSSGGGLLSPSATPRRASTTESLTSPRSENSLRVTSTSGSRRGSNSQRRKSSPGPGAGGRKTSLYDVVQANLEKNATSSSTGDVTRSRSSSDAKPPFDVCGSSEELSPRDSVRLLLPTFSVSSDS